MHGSKKYRTHLGVDLQLVLQHFQLGQESVFVDERLPALLARVLRVVDEALQRGQFAFQHLLAVQRFLQILRQLVQFLRLDGHASRHREERVRTETEAHT